MTEPLIVTEVVEKVPARFVELVKEQGEEAQFIRKTLTVVKESEFDEGERAEIGFISTGGIDRDAEILVPNGCDLSQFRKAPQVLWSHDYDVPPIGKAIWTKKDPKKNPQGILAKVVYAQTARAEEIWQLVKSGFLKTFSVGFMPTKTTWQGADDFEKECDKLHQQGMSFDRTKVRRIYLKWILLEFSKVSVPANIDALTVAVAKGMKVSTDLLGELGVDEDLLKQAEAEVVKTVVPFKDLGAAPESTEWDAAAEIRESDVEALKLMSTWFDKENEDIKTAYKLPHHRATGRHAAVWRGVAAAMGVLLGARGGVAIPSGDRRGVYNHLKKHYAHWDKEAPEFRAYVDAELKILFADQWDDILYMKHPALTPESNEHTCKLLEDDEVARVMRLTDKYATGVHAIVGIKDSDTVLMQIRFDRKHFTATQARKWCEQHDHKAMQFEPASEVKAEELAELEAIVEHVAEPVAIEKVSDPEPVVTVEVVKLVEEKQETFVEIPAKVERPIVELVKSELGRQLGKV